MLGAGCGHDVTPTDGFDDPSLIPLCCQSDFSQGCCGLDGFAFFGGVQLSWNSEDEVFAFIDGWFLYRAEGVAVPAEGDYVRLKDELLQGRDFVDTEVEADKTYWYRLASVTPAGIESVPTNPVEVRIDFTPPDPPTGLQATVDTTRVQLVWDPAPEPDFLHYTVTRKPDFPPIVFFSPQVPTLTDDTVERGLTYQYWVQSVDNGLNRSAPGDTLQVTIP